MKHILIFLSLAFLSISGLKAQAIDTLPSNKEAFVTELIQRFDETKKTELKDLSKEFENSVKQGKISDEVMRNLIAASQKMVKMRGKPYPQLQHILESYLYLNALPLNSSQWKEFQTTLMQVMENSKKGDTKTSIEFIEFAEYLYSENALVYSKGKVWKMDNSTFQLTYENTGPFVTNSNCTIQGNTVGDTLKIFNTSGKYDYFEKKWKGTKGDVNWERAGLPKEEVYASFTDYEIKMNTQEYKIDQVNFNYKNYFEKTIVGSLEDKMVTSANKETTRFPRFSADKENVPAQEITPSVFYYGGFTLAGSKVQGSSEGEKSKLVIFKENSKEKLITVYTSTITINLPEKISSSKAEISMYFEKDSIYHPSVDFFFDLTTNTIKLLKGEGSLAQSSYTDSYHKIEFNVDVITWNLSEDDLNLKTISTSGIKSAKFESLEYFSEQKMKALRGNVSYDPLSLLWKQTQVSQETKVYADNFAKMISPNLTVQQIKPMLYNLVTEGFISYDEKREEITVKPKVEHYVKANAKKKDFDNITIISNNKGDNANININRKTIDLNGVKSVPISLATSTIFFPDSQQITIEKGRDMLFDGLLFCGRMDIFGRDNHFLYDSFNMELPFIDTLIINIPDGDKVDGYGNPILRPLNSTLEQLKGKMNINIPINKSGSSELAQFPIFESVEKSRVFYEDKKIRGGTYTKDKFYYEIEPFIMDSLKHLDWFNVQFKGTLYSAGIFPDLTEPLKVQPDLSLGFELESPEEGFDIYQGKGKFMSDIALNNTGLTGSGIIKYKTTTFESSNIQFFPDSLLAVTDTFGVEESKGIYESPWVTSANNKIEWYPYRDSMLAYSSNADPFQMYGDRIRLDGFLEITEKGIHGGGIADWEDAQLISNRFQFKSDELLADTAELKIKTIDGDRVTFNTPNVNAYVDFEANTGYFKSNTDDNRTEFNYNQYATTIDEFFWDIDNKKLEFSVPEGSKGAPFVSLNLDQDTLSFIATKADYSLITSIIEASGVSEIFVADSRVIPKDGLVTIYPEAKMETLTGAIIEASAESRKHIIQDVTITINGKYDIKADGNYRYSTKNTEDQLINLSKIDIIIADSSVLEKKKNQNIQRIVHAKGTITEVENFVVYPDVQYYGDVEMFSSLDNLKIKGYTKIDFKSPYIVSDFFQVDGKVDPVDLNLTVEGAKDPQGKVIRTGIFVNKAGIEPIYTNILNNQIGPLDVALIEANGVLKHDSDKNIYTFGSEEKMESEEVMSGNILRFSPADGKIEAQGSLDFSLKYGAIEERLAGKVNTDLEKNEYTFNTAIALPIDIDKTILEKMAYYLYEDNFDMGDVDYEDQDLMYQMAELVSPKSLSKIQSEVNTTGYFLKPKDLKESFVFTDVNMTYDPIERVYRSKGKFGLAFVGEKAIHKVINGYIEFGHRLGSDYMNIYLKTSFNDYVFITYTTTLMEIGSSFDDIVKSIGAIDGSKRKIKGENNTFYMYAPGNEMKAKAYIQRMKILENGGTLPPPEPPMEKPKAPAPEEGGGDDNGSSEEEVEKSKGKNKGSDNNTQEEEVTPDNSGVPQEVLDFENEDGKGKKKKKDE